MEGFSFMLSNEKVMIKYGSIEYFTLLELKRDISGISRDKLGLANLDKLRLEVDIKIKAAEHEYNERIRKTNTVQ